MPDAPLLCPPDKARLVIALVIAKHVPNDLTPIEYVRRLRSAFPIPSNGDSIENPWLEKIEVLQRELDLAKANEARAKLELASYQIQRPPPSAPGIDGDVPPGEPTSKRSAPDSPAAGSKKIPKKKRKQADIYSTTSPSKLSSTELELALQRIQSAFDPGTHIRSIGLVATLLRLKTQTQSAQLFNESGTISHLDDLVKRCLTDVGAHIRHVCANPIDQRSFDGLEALQTILPPLLIATARICRPGPDLAHALVTLVLPIIHAFHSISLTLIHTATRATVPTRTRRGKPKTGVRAVRESEEMAGPHPADVRPGLSAILSMVARAGTGKDTMYAVLPVACKMLRDLCATITQSRASDRRTVRTGTWAVRDSVWYLCSACHVVLQGIQLDNHDAELLGGCADLVVEALRLGVCTETRVPDKAAQLGAQGALPSQPAPIASRTHMNDAVQDMLCALLERIMLGFPGS
ncbi:hypothetical protein RSOLAG1IB_03130 [Rhizoctonia solani AG-1 IB]|uniref:Uncharacterized protein n=1 Tax=Thanatephorus cucumeris (strain AG1-IB / isolate 7/3/14) TaxID=1108050 RepID=A0A0B7FN73_THACB|nr:hypothetical protein RSOLAG1IB_03130 [Rhizoctonia solani AG-1 IB]